MPTLNTPNPMTLPTYQVGVIKSKIVRRFNADFAAYLKRHSLTPVQWYAIGTIYDAGQQGIGMSRLADILGSKLTSLTEVVTILEAKGWVKKTSDSNDARARVVRICDERQQDVQAIERDLRTRMRENLYSKISPDELAAYIRVLYKLAGL
jgi:DNA-binding MarR family transcriptional regulator